MKKENIFSILGLAALVAIICMCVDLFKTVTLLNDAKDGLVGLKDIPFAYQLQENSILILEKSISTQIVAIITPFLFMILSFILSKSDNKAMEEKIAYLEAKLELLTKQLKDNEIISHKTVKPAPFIIHAQDKD